MEPAMTNAALSVSGVVNSMKALSKGGPTMRPKRRVCRTTGLLSEAQPHETEHR